MRESRRQLRLWKSVPAAAVLFACTVPSVAAAASEPADETVRRVIGRLADNEPVAIWHALPSSYQQDLHGTVHLFAEQVDADVWNQTIGTLAKLTRVLDEKREYITGHPMVAMQMQATEAPSDVYQGFVDIMTTISTSEISDLNLMRSLDLEAFFSGTLTRLMEQFETLGQLAPGPAGEVENLRETEVILESSDGDSAIVRIEAPDSPAEVKEFVLVEGKWIPKEMADDWAEDIAGARLKMADWSADSQSPDRAQTLAMLGMVNSTLDSLLVAQTAEEFNETVEGIVQLVGMMMPSDSGEEDPR